MEYLIEQVTADKKRWLELLLLADPCEAMIDCYIDSSEMYVLKANGMSVCTAVVTRISEQVCELKNLATDEMFQNQGFATEMLRYLFERYRERYLTMQVGTSDSGVSFYERFGFVPSHAVKGFFNQYPEPIYENGVQCIDMLYLKKSL